MNNLSFSVRRQECFGLLGLNGAGKSTTFKILTGELDATSGSAFINGCDIKQQQFAARQNLSFCPQFDYLPEYLTVQETFQLFAGLRAIEKTASKKCLTELLTVFKLNEFSDKLVQKLSGGNKRKVSAAISFIGRPSVVILDEPTTGLHFEDIRQLMSVLNKLVDKGNTIVVIEHSMDVIKMADHIIDVGPEGGNKGGTIVGTGTPEEIVKADKGHTARFLKLELN